MLAALATTVDAQMFGLTLTEASLLRAETRVRAYTGQQISAGTSTVTLRGPVGRLPQRPVTAITSVTDEDGNVLTTDEYTLLAGGVLEANGYLGLLTVVYAHGWDEIPVEIVEIVCTVAARLGSTDPTLAAGVTQEQSGSASQTFGWDAWRGLTSLTSEEKAALDRYFPKTPAPARVMRP